MMQHELFNLLEKKFIDVNYNICSGDIDNIVSQYGYTTSLLFLENGQIIENIDIDDDRLNIIIDMKTGNVKGFKFG